MTENGEWSKWSKHIILELKRLNTCYVDLDNKNDNSHKAIHEKIEKTSKEIMKEIQDLSKELTLLRIKVAGAAAAIGIVVTILMNLAIKNIGL